LNTELLRNFSALNPSRPIRSLSGASNETALPEDLEAEREVREQAALSRLDRSAVEELRLEFVARLAVYESIALGDDFTVVSLEAARAALLRVVDRLAIEANSKETLERHFKRLWAERRGVEVALGTLVPQGRLVEAVQARLRGRNDADGQV
jgi:hypothetical protein